jgi:hypothetical protein
MTQTASAGQCVGGNLHPVNESFAFGAGGGTFCHLCLHPMGLLHDRILIVMSAFTYHNPLHPEWGSL